AAACLRSRSSSTGAESQCRFRGPPNDYSQRQLAAPRTFKEIAMRYMILVKATKDSEAGKMPPESLFADMGRYHEELQKAGMLIDASGLKPTSKGWRIDYDGAKRSFVDGPFAETKELVAGYTIIRAKSREEAIEWTK